LSSEFHHGENTVKKGDREYKMEHGHIYEVSGKHPLDFSITKNVASIFISVFLIFIIFFSVAGSYKNRKGQAPKGLQSLIEPLIVYLRDDVIIPNIGEKKYKPYFPYLICLFFFVWFNNLLGLIPTGANASGNIAFTMTLAVFTLIITNVSGNAGYWKHIFWTPGVPLPLRVIMLPVEVLGIFTKPFALMIRLFANITAGHIIILSLLSFIFIFKSVLVGLPVVPVVIAMTCMELFVAILQAYIFTLLTSLFIGLATEDHEHHDEHH
jgi:F-type H+-transporting ATPase subunit a